MDRPQSRPFHGTRPIALGGLCILGAIGASAAAFEPSSGGDEVEYDYSGM